MTNKEFEKVLEEIAVKLTTVAQIQATIATLVHEGFTQQRDNINKLLESCNNLLETARNHEGRIQGLEGDDAR